MARGFSQCDQQQLEAAKPCIDPSKCPQALPETTLQRLLSGPACASSHEGRRACGAVGPHAHGSERHRGCPEVLRSARRPALRPEGDQRALRLCVIRAAGVFGSCRCSGRCGGVGTAHGTQGGRHSHQAATSCSATRCQDGCRRCWIQLGRPGAYDISARKLNWKSKLSRGTP